MARTHAIAYDTPGALTAVDAALLDPDALPPDVIGICRIAQALVIPPDLAPGAGIPEARNDEREIRPANEMLARLLALDPTPLVETRPPHHRVVGTCRDFTVLSCALLRHRGIPARARCGFATYFEPGNFVDHWVIEYWTPSAARWVRVDSEILGFPFVSMPEDLQPGEFLSGGEAWTLCRETDVDPMRFGVVGAPHAWGIAEVRGNAIRDLAALNKVEMLPWDEWGRMEASYRGETGPEFDALIDVVASTCASDDSGAIRDLYATEDLTVPPALVV